jgi:hypothetical protein
MHRWLAVLLLALAVALVFWWNSGDWNSGDVAPPSPVPPDRGGRAAAAGAVADVGEAAAREQASHGEGEPVAAPSAAAPAVPTGRLGVVVVDEAYGAVPGCTVTAGEQSATTDARGRAEFTAPAERLHVGAMPPVGSPLQPANGWQTVRAGETAEVRFVLAARRAFAFWLRLVAEEDGRPLRGATITGPGLAGSIASDGDGRAQVLIGSPDDFLDVLLAGRARCRVLPVAGHETPELAMQVPLAPEAALALTAVDAAGAPVGGIAARLSALPWHVTWPRDARPRGDAIVWAGTTDVRGALTLLNLPPERLLDAVFTVPEGRGSIAAARWSLHAGRNEKSVELRVHGAITGRVVDTQDRPLAGAIVCALPAEGTATPREVAAFHGGGRSVEGKPTAADGAFRIDRLAPGPWWIGLGGERAHVVEVQRVEVRDGDATDITLRARPGLPLAGRAFAPDDRPAADVVIDLHVDGEYVTSTHTGADGRFRFFPLQPGTCALKVDLWQGDLGLPQPLQAKAGDEAVELRLVPVCGTISGRVSGSAWVLALRRGTGDAFAQGTDLDGSFHYPGMLAGTWDLHAMDHAGNAAFLPAVQVLPARETSGLQLQLTASGCLVLQRDDADEVRVERDGAVAVSDALIGGEVSEVKLPPGRWTVVFRAHDAEIARREVTLRAGERLRVGSQ